ncbi:MAG: hypothetical protein ACOX18_08335 [Bacillota bacterium]
MSDIAWFEQLRQSRRAAIDRPLTLTFTVKPRGVRLNASLTRALEERGIDYVRLGVLDGRAFIIAPAKPSEGSLKVSKGSRSSSAVISSAAVASWAEELGIALSKVVGQFDAKRGVFVFPLDDLLESKDA